MAPIPKAGTATQAAAASPVQATDLPPAPAPAAPPAEAVPVDPFDGSVFAPILPMLPGPPALTADPALPTFRLGAGTIPRLATPTVGQTVDCGVFPGKGTIVSVSPYAPPDNPTSATASEKTFQVGDSGEEFLPDFEVKVSCEKTKVVGAPYGHLEKHTWQEKQRVGLDANHAFGGPPPEVSDTGPHEVMSSSAGATDDKTERTGARRAAVANTAAAILAVGMGTAVEVYVPFTRLASPAVDLGVDHAAKFVVDRLGGKSIRAERLEKKIDP